MRKLKDWLKYRDHVGTFGLGTSAVRIFSNSGNNKYRSGFRSGALFAPRKKFLVKAIFCSNFKF